MFSSNFYPTDHHTYSLMVEGFDIKGKVVLEPQAGKGDMVDYLYGDGAAEVIACENNKDLAKIVQTKCRLIAGDFLTVTSDMISHIDAIVMNPPFDEADRHILHAFNIAPAGCSIFALANYQTVDNPHTKTRKELAAIIERNGIYENIGCAFDDAERTTNIDIALIKLKKAGENYKSEFEGFFMEDDPTEIQENGIQSYNLVRDLVNRYVAAIKLYDQQLELAVQMNSLTKDYFFSKQPELGMSVTRLTVIVKREEFKKEMQKEGWLWLFEKMNMKKYATKGLKEDINKFVEQQQEIPFTMRNIYKMIEIVIGTQSQRMDKALMEVFDKLTKHYSENRFNVEGWKSNSHFLITKKFIMPWLTEVGWSGELQMKYSSINSNMDIIEDMMKALCYLTGKDYDSFITLHNFVQYPFKLQRADGSFLTGYKHYGHLHDKEQLQNRAKELVDVKLVEIKPNWGEWFEYSFFNIKCFKKGTVHFEFRDENVWALFNQNVARIMGYPLFEGKTQTKYQDKQTGRRK